MPAYNHINVAEFLGSYITIFAFLDLTFSKFPIECRTCKLTMKYMKRAKEELAAGVDRKFMAMDLIAAYQGYDDAHNAFADRYDGMSAEAFNPRNDLVMLAHHREALAVGGKLSELLDQIIAAMMETENPTATWSLVENTIRFNGQAGPMQNDRQFGHILKSLAFRLESQVGQLGGNVNGLRASHEVVMVRKGVMGLLDRFVQSLKSFDREISTEAQFDEAKRWILTLAQEVKRLNAGIGPEANWDDDSGEPTSFLQAEIGGEKVPTIADIIRDGALEAQKTPELV